MSESSINFLVVTLHVVTDLISGRVLSTNCCRPLKLPFRAAFMSEVERNAGGTGR